VAATGLDGFQLGLLQDLMDDRPEPEIGGVDLDRPEATLEYVATRALVVGGRLAGGEADGPVQHASIGTWVRHAGVAGRVPGGVGRERPEGRQPRRFRGSRVQQET